MIAEKIERLMKYSLCKQVCEASKEDLFTALALAVRELASDRMYETANRYARANPKRVYYLSMEYLLGRFLVNNLDNLGIHDLLDQVKLDNPIPLRDVIDCEYDPALGNGGLGRLAACFIDSMATLGLPGYGYGLNYQFGLFKQAFENGYQKELADSWMERSSPWQIERADRACRVPIYGRLVYEEVNGERRPHWVDTETIVGVPYDMPIVGFGGKTVNYLRLFSARSDNQLDIKTFNEGGYIKAVEKKIKSETISKVLYPSDAADAGKELRLTQQYFFVSCAISDIMRRFLETNTDLRDFPKKAAIQLNDTHPTLAIPELMRVLMDVHGLDWDTAWEITEKTMGYTNHTLLPEALERWSVALLEKVVPRHLAIIYEINDHLMKKVSEKYPDDVGKLTRMSIIEEGDVKKVRMGNLAIVGSHSINGVAAIHSDLVKKNLAPDFYEMWPKRFNNKTNGITPRRWLLSANPELASLISERIGTNWISHLDELKKIAPLAKDSDFVRSFFQIKKANKEKLAKLILNTTGNIVDTDSLFDVQVKRMHEYKRQLLNALNIIYNYLQITEDGLTLPSPRTFILGGKAAPSYDFAKLVIKLFNNLSQVINNDPRAKDQMKVVFIPDYKVSIAERVFPASDVSEQISTAGFEASGTGNMKFMLNGALTVGTLDGANVEIREEVGDENFYLFGLTTPEVKKIHAEGSHKPWDLYNSDTRIKRIMDALSSNMFSPDEPGIFKPIFQNIMTSDYYLLLADIGSYIDIQEKVGKDFLNKASWGKKAIMNVACSGKFSSDRTISEYAQDIWDVKPVL
ncbi:MAG: glycogen/starch/alpha-glucan phosphorylase [Alphaproteobacteria bacterium]|nr:glycogen/starch/alpha-glucan phosphorylase [Alphaproteobacteria bacterium]MBO4644450.1 glycogen/starch/alpha-glucan phosphorylase [Alphaproteobacteria bacterium]